MLRIALEFAVLLIAPAVLYVAYTVLISGKHTGARDALRGAPLVLLFFVGIALVFFAMVVFRSKEEATAGKTYTPPSYKDGKITPGQLK
jgi:Sec-independent protein secretion pathway component TatC